MRFVLEWSMQDTPEFHFECRPLRARFAGLDNGVMTNADMPVAEVRQICQLDEAGQILIIVAMTQLQLSARAYYRILKLARTIADLAGEKNILSIHLAEALQVRPKRMMVCAFKVSTGW